jgi:hypothetical protein
VGRYRAGSSANRSVSEGVSRPSGTFVVVNPMPGTVSERLSPNEVSKVIEDYGKSNDVSASDPNV